jgi:uncharacterized protein (DUF1015 family)
MDRVDLPPKSTYFFPKLLTGIAFNPLFRPEPGESR